MHACRRALVPVALLALLAGCAHAPAPSAPAQAGLGPAGAAADDRPELALKKGMTAAEVRRIMAAPAEIKPRPAPTGKAEVWVYHRTTFGPPQQLQVGVQPVAVVSLDADGVYRSHTLREDPIYRQARDKITETIQLLMFDDRFVQFAVTAQTQQEFQ